MPKFFIPIVCCASVVIAGCAAQKYHAAPISPEKTAASLEARSLGDPGLREFIEQTPAAATSTWPPAQWNLPELTLAAFYFNPAMQIARERLREAEARITTAGARPNPSIKADLGGETAPENPWIAGLGFSLPIETAGKRRYRMEAARRFADVARWNLAATAWSVRAQMRSALLEFVVAERRLGLLRAEQRLRNQQVQLLQQRLAVGMVPRPEVDAARIQETQTALALGAARGKVSEARASLAAAVGVPVASLAAVKIVWPGFGRLPTSGSLSPATIQEDAVLNRLDIRRALAEYAAAEAALRVEIAKQYPNFDIGPDYAFEEGAHLFSLAAGLNLPIFNRNQGPIAEAKARRDELAARFLAAQAAGISNSEQALSKYATALDQLAEAQQLSQQALAQQKATEQQLQAGESDRVALSGAELETAVTSEAKLDARYAAQQALGELENAIQRPLLPGDLKPISPQSPALYPARKPK